MTTFTAMGWGEFPTDMLRNDQCWPNSAADAMLMMMEGRRSVVLSCLSG